MNKKVATLMVGALLGGTLVGCGDKNTILEQNTAAEVNNAIEQEETKEARTMILGTTTSTEDSGLLDYLLPIFEEDFNINVSVVAKGTGAVIKLAENGDVDCLLVHDKSKEEKFVEAGLGIERVEVMYNDFIIVGPKEDPAQLKTLAPNNPQEAYQLISDGEFTFISRGDESGTDAKEKKIWSEINIEPTGDWYVSAGQGMGAVLQMASEKQAYTFTDRATYLSMKDDLELDIVTEKNESLYNQYSVIALNKDKFDIKSEEAQEFVEWITSDKVQELIGEFGKEEFGQALFVPNAK